MPDRGDLLRGGRASRIRANGRSPRSSSTVLPILPIPALFAASSTRGGSARPGCQFSFTCDGSLARKPSRMFWTRAESVARAALAGYVHEPAGLATHYHTIQIHPYWADSLAYLGTIGAHRFYRFGGAAGRRDTFRFAYAGGEPAGKPRPNRCHGQGCGSAANPVLVQQAFEESRFAASAKPARRALTAAALPAPTYTPELRARGGDSPIPGEQPAGFGRDQAGIRKQRALDRATGNLTAIKRNRRVRRKMAIIRQP